MRLPSVTFYLLAIMGTIDRTEPAGLARQCRLDVRIKRNHSSAMEYSSGHWRPKGTSCIDVVVVPETHRGLSLGRLDREHDLC
jgi:hypothetical protein